MITAFEASQNVYDYELNYRKQIKEKTLIRLEQMSKSIEFHSKTGINSLDFMPYDKSQFTTDFELQVASEIFENAFRENGYTIIQNNISQNSLKIKW